MAGERVHVQVQVHVDPGVGYECCRFAGTARRGPFVVLNVGEVALFFADELAVVEFIDALVLAGGELIALQEPRAASAAQLGRDSSAVLATAG